MVRSILAVLLGWIAVVVLVICTDMAMMHLFPEQYVAGKLPPHRFAAISLLTSATWAVIGGFLTAWLARRRPWGHILALVIWGELMGIVSTISTWGHIQVWYQIGLLVLWPPAVVLGAWLHEGRPTRGL